jgi:cell division protease FtsH
MVAQWGFAFEDLGGGPVAWETPEGNGMMQPRVASADMEQEIDNQVSQWLKKKLAENITRAWTQTAPP